MNTSMTLRSFNIDDSSWELLKDVSHSMDTDRSKLIRGILRRYLTWYYTDNTNKQKDIKEFLDEISEPIQPMF